MRGRIRKFFRWRKQNDMVKVSCLFALAAAAALASVCCHVWDIYVYADTPAEYVLVGEGSVSNKRVDELRQMEGVERVSRQMDETIQVKFGGVSSEVGCTGLSQQYIAGLPGMEASEGEAEFDGTKKIYMNEAAFSTWKQAVSEKGGDISELEAGGPEFEIRYSGVGDAVEDGDTREPGSGDMVGVGKAGSSGSGEMAGAGDAGSSGSGEMAGAGDAKGLSSGETAGEGDSMMAGDSSGPSGIRQWKTAKLVVIEGGAMDEEEGGCGFSCMVETDSRLLKEAYLLRIRFRNHDLDGLQVKALRDLGYEIQNEGVLIKEEYEIKGKLLHIQYGLTLCAACVIAAWVIGRLICCWHK